MGAGLPGLASLVDIVPAGTVLDGELISGSGRAASFYRLAPDLAGTPSRPGREVSLVAFDVLAVGGERVTDLPYAERRRLLGQLSLIGPAWCTAPSRTGVHVAELLAACQALDVEGVVAKAVGSPYRPGRRSSEWTKFKTEAWRQRHAPHRRPRLGRILDAPG